MTRYREFSALELEREGADLVSTLGGTWRAGGGMCRCPAHADRTPSLSIRVGRCTLLFKCFAGCSTLDVIAAIRALRHTIPRTASLLTPMPSASVSHRTDLAAHIWSTALPLTGSPAEAYLRMRRIEVQSPQLRYHPATPRGAGAAVRFRPALIAAVRAGPRLVAIQRIFLPCATSRAKATKLTLGRPLGGAVMLSPADTTLGLAEGVETALSASILLSIPVWAALGSERLSQVEVPNGVRRLVLLADNDPAGRSAAGAALQHFACAGRRVETLWPWAGCNDWNDVLRAEGKGEAGLTRQTA